MDKSLSNGKKRGKATIIDDTARQGSWSQKNMDLWGIMRSTYSRGCGKEKVMGLGVEFRASSCKAMLRNASPVGNRIYWRFLNRGIVYINEICYLKIIHHSVVTYFKVFFY